MIIWALERQKPGNCFMIREWFYCEDRKSAVCSQGESGSVAVKAACCLKILSEKAWKKNSKCVKLMEIEHTRFSHEFFYWRKTSGKDK